MLPMTDVQSNNSAITTKKAWGGPLVTVGLGKRQLFAEKFYKTRFSNFKDFKVRPLRPLKTLKNRAIFVRNRPC